MCVCVCHAFNESKRALPMPWIASERDAILSGAERGCLVVRVKGNRNREGCFSVNDRFFGFFLTNQTFRHQHHNSATNSSLLSSYSKPMCVRHAETSCGNQASILGNREQKNAGCDCLVVGWRVWVSLLGMLPAEEWCWVFHLLCGLWS